MKRSSASATDRPVKALQKEHRRGLLDRRGRQRGDEVSFASGEDRRALASSSALSSRPSSSSCSSRRAACMYVCPPSFFDSHFPHSKSPHGRCEEGAKHPRQILEMLVDRLPMLLSSPAATLIGRPALPSAGVWTEQPSVAVADAARAFPFSGALLVADAAPGPQLSDLFYIVGVIAVIASVPGRCLTRYFRRTMSMCRPCQPSPLCP